MDKKSYFGDSPTNCHRNSQNSAWHTGPELAKLDKIINYNFYSSDFDMHYVNLGVFGAKESISVLKIITFWMYGTVLYCTVQKRYICSQNCLIWLCYMSIPLYLGPRNSFLKLYSSVQCINISVILSSEMSSLTPKTMEKTCNMPMITGLWKTVLYCTLQHKIV